MESFAISVSHIQATLNGGLKRKRELEWMLRLELLRLQDRDLSRQRRFRLVKLGLNNGESEVTGPLSGSRGGGRPRRRTIRSTSGRGATRGRAAFLRGAGRRPPARAGRRRLPRRAREP